MRTVIAELERVTRAQVLRVRLCPQGLAELSAAGGFGQRVSAELLDADGEVCGRADRRPDPCSRASTGLMWHVQLGGVLASRVWAAQPMGCGAGDVLHDAVKCAMDDLRAQALRRLDCAAKLSEIFNG